MKTYVIINNTYHLHMVMAYLKNTNQSIDIFNFIIIEHTINKDALSKLHNNPVVIERAIKSYFDYINLYRLNNLNFKVNNLPICCNDLLLVFTEYEEVNCAIIKLTKKRGGRVFLVEDNGVGSYIQFKLPSSCFRKTKRKAIIRKMLNVDEMFETVIDGYAHSRMPDHYIDKIIYSEAVSHSRNIETVYSNTFYEKSKVDIDCNSIMFVNQDLYNIYISFDGHLASLMDCLLEIEKKYVGADIYFRFHPRESEDIRKKIASKIKESFPTVKFDKTPDLYESIYEKNITHVYGFFSSVLFELKKKGIYTFLMNKTLLKYGAKGKTFELISSIEADIETQIIDVKQYIGGECIKT